MPTENLIISRRRTQTLEGKEKMNEFKYNYQKGKMMNQNKLIIK